MTLADLRSIRQRAKARTIDGAFAEGWLSGAYGQPASTARQVGERYPTMIGAEITAYLNGAEDGGRGDRFRLDMGNGEEGRS